MYSAQRKNVCVAKVNPIRNAVETVAGITLMSFFPLAIVYCYVQISLGNG
jgi:hypothetical protein